MSTSILALFILSSVLATCMAYPEAINPVLKEKEKTLMVIEGMVYCQSCAKAGTWSLTGACPLAAAKVGISCKDYKNRVGFYKSVTADNNGYFYCPVEGLDLKYYKGEFVHACTAKLLSSPDSECNSLTNINGGIEGSRVIDASKTVVAGKGYKTVVYSTGPLAFRPSQCPPLVHY